MAIALCGLAALSAAPAPVLAAPPPAAAPDGTPEGDGPWVVRARFTDRDMVARLAAEIEPWEVRHDEGYLVVGVDYAGYLLLLDLGFRVEVDADLTAKMTAPRRTRRGQVEGIPGFPCYRTVEETFDSAAALAAARPDLATWIDVGDSWEKTVDPTQGYDLLVLRLTDSAIAGPKPKLFVMASMHAREYTPAELVTRFAERLVAFDGADPDVTWLLDHHEIHLLLQANPDGRKWAEQGLWWRKNTDNDYCSDSNDRGVDLNRNYEFLWGCCGGSSGSECSETFRGPEAASEPETQTVQNYVRAQFPDQRDDDPNDPAPVDATGVFVDVHSFSELVLWPWGYTENPAPNGTALQTLGRKLAWFNGYFPEQAIGLYITDGTTDDFAYGDLGLAAYTFELGTTFFQACSTFEESILEDNLAALLYAAKVARTPYMTPAGPDALGVAASPDLVAPGEPVELTATLDDTRYQNANGAEPTQPIAAASATVDQPPWAGGTPIPLAPVDGAFDSPVEAARATIDTTGLADGRHLAFVTGVDADGNQGAPSAAFFWVLDPANAPWIEGWVLETGSGLPLAATVAAGAFSGDTDPATGYYAFMLPPGIYTVTATAADHAPRSVDGVEAVSSETVRVDFDLDPICAYFEDDLEAGAPGWTAEGDWALSDEAAHSPSHAWSDSPGGDYANFRDDAVVSPPLDLSAVTGVKAAFWHVYDLEPTYDFGYLEYSADGGASWSTAATYNGWDQSTWTYEEIPVPALDGQPDARLRFRIETDFTVTGDGWHVDDVAVLGGSASCAGRPPMIFSDGFESGDTSAWSASSP